MGKLLELVGFGFIGGTIYAFTMLIPQNSSVGWPVFWGCAGAALTIILYRNMKRKSKTTTS